MAVTDLSEDELNERARVLILQRICTTNEHGFQYATTREVLELAEAYTILTTGRLSGRINAPQ